MASFWAKKLMEKMKFTDYWKVLVLNFSVVENTVFFWVKKLMERWYLLVTEKFLFWTFRWWENTIFFQPKSWWKDDIYLVFLSFPWYSRTWKIRVFVQSHGLSIWQFCKDSPKLMLVSQFFELASYLVYPNKKRAQ